MPPVPHQAPAQTCGLAIGSMVCGILGFLTAGLTGIVAVILGHIGLSQIKKSNGALAGRGYAVTGLVTGYMTALILPIAVIAGLVTPMILRQREAAERAEMMNNMRQIGLAMMMFDEEYGALPSDDTAKAVADLTGAELSDLQGSNVLNQFEVSGTSNSLKDLLAVSSRTEGDWIYFPGHKTTGDPGQEILVSPSIRGKAMVLTIDCAVRQITGPQLGSLRASPDAVEIPAPRR